MKDITKNRAIIDITPDMKIFLEDFDFRGELRNIPADTARLMAEAAISVLERRMEDVREYADAELPGVPVLLTEDQTPEEMAAMLIEALGEIAANAVAATIVTITCNKWLLERRQ